ncbi:hypothetical protein [Arthrobacter sp. UM1]|uniref:hypothetical protein n=1 Tax=Arthrobacter sp. UM1 TaxID=2766776 RepID=UPI001CF6D964|nr:hypothetical protein [Arthrobacter sp. UM1]MCB4209205.1 hypothetical protein [Arthrobacter sp. UM1]
MPRKTGLSIGWIVFFAALIAVMMFSRKPVLVVVVGIPLAVAFYLWHRGRKPEGADAPDRTVGTDEGAPGA